MTKKIVWAATAVLCGALSSSANAQQSLVNEYYGEGVHAFFAGRDQQALQYFNAAVRGGSRDPRLYYFRGMTLERMGRSWEAQRDFGFGARFEAANGGDQYYNVGLALERIQGRSRIQLETYRRGARLAARESQLAREKARYEQLQQSKPRVLRGGAPDADTIPQPPAAGADKSDPFSKAGEGAITDAPEKPTPPATPGGVFGEDPMGGAKPAQPAPGGARDPFGGDSPAPAGGDPMREKMDPATDPFGDDPPGGATPPRKDAGDDPFGG